MPSVSEIARRAGVSKSTVSLVLNNRPNVSNATRQRVIQALEDLQRVAAASSVKAEQRINALLIHPILLGSQQVFRELLQGVKNGIEEADGKQCSCISSCKRNECQGCFRCVHYL